MCHVFMINFLMIMEKAVRLLGSITLQDKKIKSNNYQFMCVGRFINILVLILLRHLNWIENYSTMKIGRFFFCSSMRRLGSFFGVQNFEFQYFWGFSIK